MNIIGRGKCRSVRMLRIHMIPEPSVGSGIDRSDW
jgi:hypothetical protein